MTETIGVVGVLVIRVINGETKYLLARRLGRLEHGRFSPPGGHILPGESLKEAGAREALEESSLKIPIDSLEEIYEGIHEFNDQGLSFLYHGFRVLLTEEMGEAQDTEPDKREKWEWCPREITPLSLSAQALLEANRVYEQSAQPKVIRKNYSVDR